MSVASSRIPLRIANKKAYVWDVDDIAQLRSEHHICGVLLGTLPHLSQQNVFLGVPLVLMPEEVVLLIQKGIAVLVDDPNAHDRPTTEQLKEWNSEYQDSVRRQLAMNETKGASESAKFTRAISAEAFERRRRREEKRLEESAITPSDDLVGALTEGDGSDKITPAAPPPSATPSTAGNGTENSGSINPSLSTMPNRDASSAKTATMFHTIVVPTESSSLKWYSDTEKSYSTLESARKADIWDYPLTLQERARCAVFRDLWEKGYFMGVGIKFGADYLVYPGDPLRYHSHFAATVLEGPSTALRPMEIVAHGRLGTATKKAHLLCCWDGEKKEKEVSYLSIEWAGFG